MRPECPRTPRILLLSVMVRLSLISIDYGVLAKGREVSRSLRIHALFCSWVLGEHCGSACRSARDHCLGWIDSAGGIAVVAHPARYKMTASKLRRFLGEFREAGGAGMEVISGSHTHDNVIAMAALCRTQNMLASCGSDYHGPENPWIKLGQLPELPADCSPVWESQRWSAA